MFFSFIKQIELTVFSIAKTFGKLKWFLPVMWILLLCGCGQGTFRVSRTDTGMGTVIQMQLFGTEESQSVSEKLFYMIDEMEGQEISWRYPNSLVGRINQGQQGVSLNAELYETLLACKEISVASEGAFDITIGKLTRLWDIDSYSQTGNMQYVLPEKKAIEEACKESGYFYLEVKNQTATLTSPIQIDLGAVGKGIALDRILNVLEEADGTVYGGVISLGGSILTYGDKQDGTPWQVGIVDPFDTDKCLGVLKLFGQWCISTSGDYERYVEVDGVRYHHILDPRTGYPANSGVRSVTILSKSGFLSDALSTACYVLGVEKGMELAQKYQAEALFVDSEGKQYLSEGMKKFFCL